MNCDDFSQRLQWLLDERLRLESDRRLQRHARQCELCRGQLDAWQQIASIMPAAPDRRQRGRSLALCGLAAAALIALVVHWNLTGPRGTIADRSEHPLGGDPVAVASRDVDPVLWWQGMQDRDWVAQTMPAVRNLREGVAPLGRSLLQAVTILTLGGGEQTT